MQWHRQANLPPPGVLSKLNVESPSFSFLPILKALKRGGHMSEKLYSRIFGCMVGNSIGDAFGGVVEFANAERLRKITGKLWVDEFLRINLHEFP